VSLRASLPEQWYADYLWQKSNPYQYTPDALTAYSCNHRANLDLSINYDEAIQMSKAPIIRRLSIQRFRSLRSMTWWPTAGVNFILGGGDVGKTTILDAIALLLSPTNPNVMPDTDYYGRIEEHGFVIDAVVSLPVDIKINNLLKASWPWDWNGKDPVVPNIDVDGTSARNDPVYWLQVTGTPELELVYEIKQPDGTTENLPVSLRRQLGPVRLSGDDRNDRDLRFVQGSALDRLLSDKTLRSRLSNKLAETNVTEGLSEDGKTALLVSVRGEIESYESFVIQ
jgi:putative ATP-dependent endonuclease of the OLD family